MFDAIVIGLGAMGSATLYELARRGLNVLGLEQFHLAHDLGSSHGETRIIRRAYFEHPAYVPLVDRSFELWARLEAECRTKLFHRTGLLLAGPGLGNIIAGTSVSTAAHRLSIHQLPVDECIRSFPGLRPTPDMTVLFEPDAGFLEVEKCVRTYVQAATSRGAQVRTQIRVDRWIAGANSFDVFIGDEIVSAQKLAVCGGPWSSQLLRDFHIPLKVLRKPVVWFETSEPRYICTEFAARPDSKPRQGEAALDSKSRQNGAARPGAPPLGVGDITPFGIDEMPCPIFGFDTSDGFIYGFPSIDGQTVKVANHTGGEVVSDPSQVDRALRDSDVAPLRSFLKVHLPGVSDRVNRHSICMYTMTPDEHFVIDRHPRHENLVFAAGFSGHGFKFAPLIGSVLADLLVEGRTMEPIEFLRLDRPALRA